MSQDNRQRFFDAVKVDDRAAIRQLLEQDAELVNARNEANLSAVLLAVYHHHSDLARELGGRKELDICEAAAIGHTQRAAQLLKQHPSSANEFSPDGFPVLGYAAFFGHPETLALLLESGADPNAQARNQMRVCPLHAALAHPDGQTAVAMAERLLAAGADTNVHQQGGWTPLHAAAARGSVELINMLLGHGADITAKNDDGKTAFELATEKDQPQAAALLTLEASQR